MKKITMSLALLTSLSSWGQTLQKAVELPSGQLVKTLGHLSGLSLYVFDPDLHSGGSSVCINTCAEKWPPYILTQDEIDHLKEPLGFIVRHNGLKQLTVDLRPVYLFYLDRTFSDAKGDGLGGVWHIVNK